MWAFEGTYGCEACGARATLPTVDLSFFYGHYFGLTAQGEAVIGDAFSDNHAFDVVVDFVREAALVGDLPPDLTERNLHWWILEEAVDRAPSGNQFHCAGHSCPSCRHRALELRRLDDTRIMLDPIPAATHSEWSGLNRSTQSTRLRTAAERVLESPWFSPGA